MSKWLDHNWISVNIGGESVCMCDRCGKTFDEADDQEDPIICWGEEADE